MRLFDYVNELGSVWYNLAISSIVEAGILLAIVAGIWLLIHKKASAQLGYGLFLLVILKLFLPVDIHVPRWAAVVSPSHNVKNAVEWVRQSPAIHPRPAEPIASPVESQTVDPASPDPATVITAREFTEQPRTFVGTEPIKRAPVETTPLLEPFSWAMLAWLCVAFTLFIWFVVAQWKTGRMVKRAKRLDITTLPLDWCSLTRRIGLKRDVAVYASGELASPAIWGGIKPCLILPADLPKAMSPRQLQWVVLHELAHIRRHDLSVALLQRVARIVFFFNPAVWIASWAIDQLREYACDDTALAVSGASRKACGEGFLSIVERTHAVKPRLSNALGFFHPGTFIRKRLMRILDKNTPRAPKLSLVNLLAILLLAAILLPGLKTQGQGNGQYNLPLVLDETSQFYQFGKLHSLTANRDGSLIVTSTKKGLMIWEPRKSLVKPTHQIDTGKVYYHSMYFGPDEEELWAVDFHNFVKIYDTNSWQIVAKFHPHYHHTIRSIDFSRDGNKAVTVDDEGEVKLWFRGDLSLIARFQPRLGNPYCAKFTPDQTQVAVLYQYYYIDPADGWKESDSKMVFWDLDTFKPVSQKKIGFENANWYSNSSRNCLNLPCFFFSKGDRIHLGLTSLNNSNPRDSRELSRDFPETSEWSVVANDGRQPIAFSRDKSQFLSIAKNGEVFLRQTGHAKNATSLYKYPDLQSAQIMNDGKQAVFVCQDGVVDVWDLDGKKIAYSLKGYLDPLHIQAISPDMKTYICQPQQVMPIYFQPRSLSTRIIHNLDNSFHLKRIPRQLQEPICFSPKNQKVAFSTRVIKDSPSFAYGRNILKIMELLSMEVPFQVGGTVDTSYVAYDFSPDGKRLAAYNGVPQDEGFVVDIFDLDRKSIAHTITIPMSEIMDERLSWYKRGWLRNEFLHASLKPLPGDDSQCEIVFKKRRGGDVTYRTQIQLPASMVAAIQEDIKNNGRASWISTTTLAEDYTSCDVRIWIMNESKELTIPLSDEVIQLLKDNDYIEPKYRDMYNGYVHFAPGGQSLFIGNFDDSLYKFNLVTKNLELAKQFSRVSLYRIPNQYRYVGVWDGKSDAFSIYDCHTLKPVITEPFDNKEDGWEAPRKFAYSPTRQLLAGINQSGQLHVWDMKKKILLKRERLENPKTLPGYTSFMEIVFTPDNANLFVISGKYKPQVINLDDLH